MNDLLKDLPRGEGSSGGDIELGLQNSSPVNQDMDTVGMQIEDIEKQIEKVNKLLKKLQDANEESRFIINTAAMKANRQRMDNDIDEVRKILISVKPKIEQLNRENLDSSRRARIVAVQQKLKDKVAEFQTLRQTIIREHREAAERKYLTVSGTKADDETIDRLIENGESEQIFQRAIHGRGQVMDTLAEIQERDETVKDVEKKLLELQQIFMDMAVLVVAQGGTLDNIESKVSEAVVHIQDGNEELRKAKKYQRSSRKWTCIAVIIFLLIVVIIVVSVIRPWTSKGGA